LSARALQRYGDDPAQVVELFAPAGEPLGAAVLLHGGFWRAAYDRHLMPATFEDVTAALDLVGGPAVTIGHSAGGHLALWAAGHPNVTRAVAQAGVVDLEEAIRLELSRGAARDLLGDGDLAACSPAARLPLGMPQLLVHGADDDTVPAAMSVTYAERARAAGDPVDLAILPGVGHFEHLDPRSSAWAAVRAWL
jgi:dipeptidyl aminopeptidase/acylaminoacyl peptidase